MKNYALKWIIPRVTATLLIPLTFWFIYTAISFSEMNYNEISNFFRSYINSFLFYSMMMAMLLHSKLGLQTIIEDYVKSKKTSNAIKGLINFIAYTLMILMTLFLFKNIL